MPVHRYNEHRILIPKSNPQHKGVWTILRGQPLNTPIKNDKEMINLSEKKDKKVISLRLTEEENEMLKRNSKLYGLSQNEYVRQLCKGKTPKPQPSKEFWELLEALYDVHKGFKACAKYEPSALEICKEIECLILDLQEVG